MTPLHLRRRLWAVVTMFAGPPPDEAAEARAVYRTAYDCADDEPTADLMRHVLDEVKYQKRARDATDRALTEAVEERNKLRTELTDVDDALYAALDIRPDSLQAATMYAPGGVRRLAAERDEAVAMISTLRGELAAAVDERDKALDSAREAVAGEAAMRQERDRLYAKQQEDARILVLLWEWTHDAGNQYVPTGGDADTFGDGVRRAQERVQNILATRRSIADGPFPKRKRTKEERWEQRKRSLDGQWTCTDPDHPVAAVRLAVTALGRDFHTSRTIAEMAKPEEFGWTDLARAEAQRLVPELARAGYLTVAKGPGGVRVYSLKEGA